MSFFKELQRRNVFRVAAAYVVIAWLLIQVGATLEPAMHLPDWVDSVLAFFLLLGFPVALFLAWAYELTPEGLKRDGEVAEAESARAMAGRKWDRIIIAVLVLAVGYFALDKYVLGGRDQAPVGQAEESEETGAVEQVAATPEEGAPALVPAKSIAVLPFVNMSSDPEQEYFSDGLTEELLNLLAGISDLKVAARTSSFFYKDKLDQIPLLEVARQLEVAHVLEGSVRKGGDKIRITAQLIKADDGFHLWSETYDRTLDDVFVIQDEIAAAVVNQLKITLLGEAPHQRVIDPESYQLALQGRFLFNRRDAGDLTRALELFEQAVEIDPGNHIAWIGLSPLYGWMFDPPRLDDSLDAANRALALEPGNPEALARKARALFQAGRTDEGFAAWERALENGQDNPLILSMQAGQHFQSGEIDRGLDWQRRALAADPLHLVNISNTANYLLTLGRWHDAQEYVAKYMDLAPDSPSGKEWQAQIALQQGRPEECLLLLAQAPPQSRDRLLTNFNDMRRAMEVMAQHDIGNQAEAERLLAEYVEAEKLRVPMEVGFNTAAIYAYMGDAERAFEWIERALEARPDPSVQHFLDWKFAKMFDDPRWQRVRDLFPEFQGWDQVRR